MVFFGSAAEPREKPEIANGASGLFSYLKSEFPELQHGEATCTAGRHWGDRGDIVN
jgi:hypothetical protein